MDVTLPANLLYFSVLEIVFGLMVILFAGFQWKYEFQVALQTRHQKKIGLVVCLLIFFVILGVQLHLDLPHYKYLLHYIYGSVAAVVVLEVLEVILNKNQKDKSGHPLRNVGLMVMGLVFICIGCRTWP